MKALVDGDILRYEIGFAAETGWRAITGSDQALPPFDYVENLLLTRLGNICALAGADEYELFVTEGETIRFRIATIKPYKGTRKENKPWHFNNLSVYMKGVLNATVVTEIEADDAMAMASNDDTIICSRDKDLRQIPGWVYSWEIGKQPSFGPRKIDWIGDLSLSDGKPRKLAGHGLAFFFAQVLTGDTVDNIPGLPKCGPVAAYEMLKPLIEEHISDTGKAEVMERIVSEAYEEFYGNEWEEQLLEQGQLCWMIRRFDEDGKPELWSPGIYK